MCNVIIFQIRGRQVKKLQMAVVALMLIGLSGCAMPPKITGGGPIISLMNEACPRNWCYDMDDGISAYVKGDYNKAIEGLEMARRKHSTGDSVYAAFLSSVLLCQTYYDQRQYEKAIELCNVAILYGENYWGRLKGPQVNTAWDNLLRFTAPYGSPGELIPAVTECKNILKEAQKRSGGR